MVPVTRFGNGGKVINGLSEKNITGMDAISFELFRRTRPTPTTARPRLQPTHRNLSSSLSSLLAPCSPLKKLHWITTSPYQVSQQLLRIKPSTSFSRRWPGDRRTSMSWKPLVAKFGLRTIDTLSRHQSSASFAKGRLSGLFATPRRCYLNDDFGIRSGLELNACCSW